MSGIQQQKDGEGSEAAPQQQDQAGGGGPGGCRGERGGQGRGRGQRSGRRGDAGPPGAPLRGRGGPEQAHDAGGRGRGLGMGTGMGMGRGRAMGMGRGMGRGPGPCQGGGRGRAGHPAGLRPPLPSSSDATSQIIGEEHVVSSEICISDDVWERLERGAHNALVAADLSLAAEDLRQAQAQLKEAKEETSSLRCQCAELQNKVASIGSERDTLIEKLTASESKLDKAARELEAAKRESSSLETSLTSANAVNLEHERELKELRSGKAQLLESLESSEKEKSSMQLKMRENERECQKLREMCAEFEKQLHAVPCDNNAAAANTGTQQSQFVSESTSDHKGADKRSVEEAVGFKEVHLEPESATTSNTTSITTENDAPKNIAVIEQQQQGPEKSQEQTEAPSPDRIRSRERPWTLEPSSHEVLQPSNPKKPRLSTPPPAATTAKTSEKKHEHHRGKHEHRHNKSYHHKTQSPGRRE